MNKFFSAILSVFIFAFATVSIANAETAVVERGNEAVIEKGEGYAPERAKSPGHARMLARQAAILDGYRRLAARVGGMHMTGTQTIEDNILEGNTSSGEIDALVKGAEIVSTEYEGEGKDVACYVTLKIPAYGENSVASVVFKPHPKQAFLAPLAQAKTQNNYSGVILNCVNVSIVQAYSPTIVSDDNREIYDYKNIDRETAVENGLVSYVSSMDEATRAGNNPLIINVNSLDSKGNPVISSSDADKLLAENQSTHFLDKCSVVFVVK